MAQLWPNEPLQRTTSADCFLLRWNEGLRGRPEETVGKREEQEPHSNNVLWFCDCCRIYSSKHVSSKLAASSKNVGQMLGLQWAQRLGCRAAAVWVWGHSDTGGQATQASFASRFLESRMISCLPNSTHQNVTCTTCKTRAPRKVCSQELGSHFNGATPT